MAGCSNCGSENFRLQEPGALHNSYFCMNCKTAFERLSPQAKTGGASIVLAGVVGVVSALFGFDLGVDNDA